MINRLIHFEKFWFILAVYIAVIIFLQSNRPAIISNEQFYDLQFDKLLHMSAWISLSFSLRLGTNSFLNRNFKDKEVLFSLLLIIVCSFYGIIDEIHQMFIPYRTADIFDALADAIGSVIGVLLGHFLVINTKSKTI